MTSFGRYLVQERELRALSREEVARVTRLSPGAIAALEEDRFETLPAEVFTIGYIRSYAACIGLDANEAVLRYQESRQGSAPAASDGPAVPPASSKVRRVRLPGWAIAGALGFGAGLFAALRLVWR
ncbi:MAG: helix-turn-helix domain-containing protein [Deltaproteobacteria bacterium]